MKHLSNRFNCNSILTHDNPSRALLSPHCRHIQVTLLISPGVPPPHRSHSTQAVAQTSVLSFLPLLTAGRLQAVPRFRLDLEHYLFCTLGSLKRSETTLKCRPEVHELFSTLSWLLCSPELLGIIQTELSAHSLHQSKSFKVYFVSSDIPRLERVNI